MHDIEQEIITRLRQLTPQSQQQILTFIRALTTPHGTHGKMLLQFAGRISAEDLERMEIAIEDCEKIDPDGW